MEPIKDGAVPSALGFKKINETVEKLEKQFRALEELATNPEIIERIKTSRPDPLTDMWSMININKRLDASEQGISKVNFIYKNIFYLLFDRKFQLSLLEINIIVALKI